MPNGIELILADHRRVDELFVSFAETGDSTLVGQIVDALTMHDAAEHAALYPFLGAILGDRDAIERSSAAHQAVKAQIDLVKAKEGSALTAAVEELRALVEAHVADEEKRMLPALGEQATPTQLDALGARILQAKQRVG